MKNTVLTVLGTVLIFQFAAHAQGVISPAASSVDSIQKLVNAHPKEDTTKVNLLNALARFCFYDLQFGRGIKPMKEARDLAKKINYLKGEGLYLRALSRLSDDTPLFIYYDAQTRWFYGRQHVRESVSMVENYGKITLNQEKRLIELFAALKSVQQTHDVELTAIVLDLIRGMYLDQGKFKESLQYADQAIQAFKKIGQDWPAFFVLTTKMKVFELQKQEKQARELESQVLGIIAGTKDTREKALLCEQAGYIFARSKFGLALEHFFLANTLLEQVGDIQVRVEILNDIGNAFNALMMSKRAADYYSKALPLLDSIPNYPVTAIMILRFLAYSHIKLKEYKKADHYIKMANEWTDRWGINNDFFNHDAQGQMLFNQGHPKEALVHFRLSSEYYMAKSNTRENHPFMNLYIGQCYLALGNYKESVVYGEKAYEKSFSFNTQELRAKSTLLLTEAYDRLGQPLKAYKYLQGHRALMKSNEDQDLVGRSSTAQIEEIIQKSEQEKAALEREKLIKDAENQNQRWWLITAAGILTSVFVVLFVLYRNNRQKQRANTLLHRQKEEIDYQRSKVENALTDLKATQTQLIQKEKLAGLGELTAGIAHEIQNPLNFVNNFSEVSAELVGEFRDGPFQQLPDSEKEYAEEILGDLTSNLQKIRQHGGRASSIVKGMLEHSRTDSEEKQPTDLNALADEYLKIAYHGIRAKDKSFNCELVTDLDPALKPLEVVPQEIGRVLLNLYNNAFYAVSERQKQQSADYQPTIWVSTKQIDKQVEIRVRDNGTGIPDSVKAKIFQHFFTTKPTGEGTGLGLSLSYDIITKGHGGTLLVTSTEGGGSEFVINLRFQSINE